MVEDLSYQAGDGIDNLLEELAEKPDVGIPMYGPLINTVTRGARLKKCICARRLLDAARLDQ